MTPGISAVAEGAILDDAGNLIMTTYVDLRDPSQRTQIPALVRGCRREHALEDGETVLISKPSRFREFGEGLIQDAQEGFALEQTVTDTTNLSSADVARQHALADQNEANELVNPSGALKRTETRESSETTSKSLSYGKEWWILSTSIEPDANGWDAWRETLSPEYDHISQIGQPAKFAQALARMVAEQIGAQGDDGHLKQTVEGVEGITTQLPTQWVFHGPVVYSDQPYRDLAGDEEGIPGVPALIFTKSAEYAAQREYRFAIFCHDNDAETVRLRISGMMRDSLTRTTTGLVRRPAPQSQQSPSASQAEPPTDESPSKRQSVRQTKTTERQTRKEHRRTRVRRPDGKVESLQEEQHEHVTERVITEDRQAASETPAWKVLGDETESTAPSPDDQPKATWHSDEAIVRELTGAAAIDRDKAPASPEAIVQQDRGPGPASVSIDDSFASIRDQMIDPATPWPVKSTPSQDSILSPDDVLQIYGAIDTLSIKMAFCAVEHQKDVASASWFAMHCIRNIYAKFGCIVRSIAIERNRFVVIRLTDSNETGATGRIAIAPSGVYAYCLQLEKHKVSGWNDGGWATMHFPMGNVVESFEEFGWPAKADEEPRGQA